MRLTVQIGSELLRIPCEPYRTVAWLQSELIRRYEALHKGVYPSLSHLRTLNDNIILYSEDQLIEVCHEDERLCAITQSTHETLEPQAGDMLAGSYYFVALAGVGATGRVFRARDLNLNREVAVKILKTEKVNEINTRRFLREAELNATLSYSPHIVSVYDAGRTRTGILYMVMELLRGRSLHHEMEERVAEQRPFSSLELIHIMTSVLKGLHAAHTHRPQIIHRDVKLENIWLNSLNPEVASSSSDASESTSDSTPVRSQPPILPPLPSAAPTSSSSSSSSNSHHITATLMDFGIATHSDMRHQTLACGTRMYASPEQMRRIVNLTPSSDLWSTCVCMWSMMTLQIDVPFDPIDLVLSKAETAPDLESFLQSNHPHDEQYSHELCDIVMKGLQVDITKRWQSAQDMLNALQIEEQKILRFQLQQYSDSSNTSSNLKAQANLKQAINESTHQSSDDSTPRKAVELHLTDDSPTEELMTCPHCHGVGKVQRPQSTSTSQSKSHQQQLKQSTQINSKL